jgi:hypothetical protein
VCWGWQPGSLAERSAVARPAGRSEHMLEIIIGVVVMGFFCRAVYLVVRKAVS